MSRRLVPSLVLALLGVVPLGCGGGDATDASVGRDAPSAPDAPSATDAASSSDDTGAVAALHGCEEGDFQDLRSGPPDSRMVMVPRGTLTFDNPCITISVGQSVMFMWDFAAHPLAPGVAPGMSGTGTEPSPIEPQSSGALYEPAFPAPGVYPYYCTLHHASGMVGVVRVEP
ncbi:MAG: hypothetical protein K1X94_07835 [Sandaracinaceae bacterium]|jgi:plastocyanin|nr:hypothetical protein [Sandaracinaceae bacterium]